MAEDMEQQVNAIFQPRGRSIVGTATTMCPAEYFNSGVPFPVSAIPMPGNGETYEGVMTTSHPPRERNRTAMTVLTGTIAPF